jgi:hypothetical protein
MIFFKKGIPNVKEVKESMSFKKARLLYLILKSLLGVIMLFFISIELILKNVIRILNYIRKKI